VVLRSRGLWATANGPQIRFVRAVDLSYNVYRWYEGQTGRYTRPDPIVPLGDLHRYLYAVAKPVFFIDPMGEKSRVCCTPVPLAPGPAKHCYIEYEDENTKQSTTYALHRVKGKGCKYRNDGFDRSRHPDLDPRTTCGPWSSGCDDKPCIERAFEAYPNPSDYQLVRGPNSNSFARTLTDACGLQPPSIAGELGQTPGWSEGGRPARDTNFRCPSER